MKLSIVVKDDQEYAKFKRIVKNSFHVDADKVLKEIVSMHSARTIRGLKSKDLGARKIMESATLDQSYRSRCVELSIEVNQERGNLQIAYDAIHGYLLSSYSKHIAARSIADRTMVVDALPSVKKARGRIEELEVLQQNVAMVMEDFDRAGFLVKHLIEGLSLKTKREYIA